MTRATNEPRTLRVLEHAPVLVWISDPSGVRTYFNQTWLEFTGRALEQELGDGWEAGVHPDDLDRCLAAYREALEDRRPFSIEYRLRRHDGAYRWVLDRAAPYFDDDGEFAGYVGSCTDVDVLREAESELAAALLERTEAYALLDALFAHLPVGVAVLDVEGRYLRVNEALAAINGIPVEEHVGKRVAELLPEMWPAFRRHHEQVIATGKPRQLELSGRTRVSDDERSWILSLAPVVRADGAVLGTCTAVHDITERRAAQTVTSDALENAQRRAAELHAVLESMPDGVLVGDEHAISLASRQALALLGLTSVDELPSGFRGLADRYRFYHSREDRLLEPSELPFTSALEGEPATLEARLVTSDGAPGRFVRFASAPIRLDAESRGAVVVATDVTRRREIAGALAARERQQKVVAALGRRALEQRNVNQLLGEAVDRVAETLQTDFAKVLEWRPARGTLLMRAAHGWPLESLEQAEVPAGADSHASYTMRIGKPVIVEDLAMEQRFDPPPMLLGAGVVSGVSVVIEGRDGPFGVLEADSKVRRTFSEDDVNFLQSVANVMAAAIDRSRRDQAQALLAEAGEAFAGSIDFGETLRNVGRIAVPRLADWCAVYLADESDEPTRPKAVLVRSIEGLELVGDEVREARPALARPVRGIGHVLRNGAPSIFPEITPAMIERTARDEEQLEELKEIGPRSAIIAPLQIQGRDLGAIVLALNGSERQYGGSDLAVVGDLAARAALALENARLYREAKEAIRDREDFLSIASHELRSPLTSVVGFAARLARRARSGAITLDEGTVEEVETILREAERMHGTLEVFLDVARLETGRFVTEFAPIELRRLVEQETAALEQRHPDVAVTVRCEEDSLIVDSDELRVRQIVTNLLENAARYGGSPAAITVTGTATRDGASVTVRDEGPGIPEEVQPRIFQRFFRQTDESQRSRGLGLGLYISHQIAERLGGTLTFESVPGEGTEFTLTLPREAPRRLDRDATERRVAAWHDDV